MTDAVDAAPQPRRTLSRESCAVLTSARETDGAFAAFLSDSSDDEDEDDADTRALLRMQQQADDSAYSDAPFKMEPPVKETESEAVRAATYETSSVADVLDLLSIVERASRVIDDHLALSVNSSTITHKRELLLTPSPRKTSVRCETESSFADFLSDGSNHSQEEDEDDAETRALVRMQQQADDSAYVATSLIMDRGRSEDSNHSFRLTLAQPGSFNTHEGDELRGPRKLVEEAKRRESAVNETEEPVDTATDQGDACILKRNEDKSLADESDSFVDELRPSFSDEHSFTRGGDSVTETSFVYRLSDEEPQESIELLNASNADHEHHQPSFLSPSASSFIRSNDAVAFTFQDMDSSFKLHEGGTVSGITDSFSSVLTASSVSTSPPKLDTTQASRASIKPPLSRQSSVASSTRSQDSSSQHRALVTRESWRVSSLDFQESKHAFDEELGPFVAIHSDSPRGSAVQPRHRLSSTFEERTSVASTPSSSFASSHSQVNFFVDDIPSSLSSLSLASRASGDDSFANVAILGDDVRDHNERRSSDLISSEESELESFTSLNTVETLGCSYNNLVETTTTLDRSFSKLVDRQGFYPVDRDNTSVNGTSLGSSLALSALSHSSAASDELPFMSFNVVKSPPSTNLVHQENKLQLSRQEPSSESQHVLYRSLGLPRDRDVKAITLSRAPASVYSTGTQSFSSAALLAAIKTRDVRTDTQSEETEAGDVARGALSPLEPPLKINVVPRGRKSLLSGSSPSNPASPVAMSDPIRASMASSTGTADRLDFTGVYRGSVNSLEASRHDSAPSQPLTMETRTRDEHKALELELVAVKLARSISDSRTLQRESQRKVEEFFRQTDTKSMNGIADRQASGWVNRPRARTTGLQCVEDMEEEPRHFALNSNKMAKIIHLKNLHTDTRRGFFLEEEAPLTPQYEALKPGAMGMTTGTTSTGTTATRSMPSDLLPMPPTTHVISPQADDTQKPKMLQNGSRLGAVSTLLADNIPLTPSLPWLSTTESPAFSPSSNGFNVISMGRSPVAFAGTASGFRWKTASNLAAEAPFDASSMYSQRSTLAGRVQSLSASLASTLHRFFHGHQAQQQAANSEVTSPQSQCTAPAALPRAYDHSGFYEMPFKVPGLQKPFKPRQKKTKTGNERVWTRQWLILATCTVLGLSLGALLVRVVRVDATVFNLSADEAQEAQESNGEMVSSATVQWLVLPGHLFLRVWTAVTTLLLVCYVSTGLADLVGCADKSTPVLSFRSIGYVLLLAVLATLEGVVTMWITYHFGWFRGAAGTEASTLSDTLGVTPLSRGIIGLLCTQDGEYLQRLGHDVFVCSNASLTLPLYEQVTRSNTSGVDSGPAVFALHEITQVFATPTSVPYYPASLGSRLDMTRSFLSALTSENLVLQLTQVELDEMASLSGLVVFGLLLGFVCGKRILRLRRDVMFQSIPNTALELHASRYYIVSILMELQLALEWLVDLMERYLAPLGFFSLLVGELVAHHQEWRAFTSSMSSLIVSVLGLFVFHAVVVLPLVLTHFSRLSLLTTIRAFIPIFLFAFTTNNIALSAPVMMQCYARGQSVTRSAAQLVTAVTAALTRNARALYLPLLLLWLLETSSEVVALTFSDYLSVGLLSLLSSFCGGSTRVTLAMARTLWSITVSSQSSNAARALPATMPLLVLCDVILSRAASVLNVADHVVLTKLAAQYWDETVVHGPADRTNASNNDVPSPSPLDDSQLPRPSSSALLSSVYL